VIIYVIIDLQRETEEKGPQPETKLSAIAQTRHIARLRGAKRSRTRNSKPTHGARDRPTQPPKCPQDEGGPRDARPASLHGLIGQVPEQRQGWGPKAPEGLNRHICDYIYASFAMGAARAPGFAAAARDASKRRAYRQVSSALPFVPMSVESFGRLGAPALTLLGDLADQAVQAGGPGLSRAVFISGALRELSVALCRGNASLCRSGAYVATRAAGRAPMRGLTRPSAEVV
jgi:hypothetical protein